MVIKLDLEEINYTPIKYEINPAQSPFNPFFMDINAEQALTDFMN